MQTYLSTESTELSHVAKALNIVACAFFWRAMGYYCDATYQYFALKINRFISWVTEMGARPEDSDDEKLKKASLAVMALPFAFAGLIWGVLYFAYDLWIPGSIPFSYGILSLLSFAHFGMTKKYHFFRSSQLTLILFLPFFLQLSLGGFIPASGVIMWAFICPLGALVFLDTQRSKVWFGAYIVLLIIAYVINDQITTYFNWPIEESFINMVFLMNILGVSALIYTVQMFFVGKQTQLKKEVEEQTVKLQALDEAKSRFFANISHEFRTPLTLIQGLIDKQLLNPEQSPDAQDVAIMKRNVNRLQQLINQLLDLSKLESGEIRLNLHQGDLLMFIQKMVSLFESTALDKAIKLELKQNEIGSIVAPFDEDKLYKVLTNLLSNAIKFTPEKGTVLVNISIETEANQLKINVSNTGSGIPDEKLPYIFDRFYQVESGSTRRYEGTGIGLALVKELIELHQGRIEVTSEDSLTTFSLWLALDSSVYQTSDFENAPVETAVEDIAVPRPRLNNKTVENGAPDDSKLVILVAEDNPDLQYFIKDILSDQYHVIQALDGERGLQLARKEIPDLIISDVMMPRMDGFEMSEQIKKDPLTDHIPIIMLTAKASKENKLEGLELGADDYLTKPFDKEELLVRIANLISTRRKLQEKFGNQINLKPDQVKVDSQQVRFLNQVKEVIEENISNDQFSVDDLSDSVGMSRSQLHRKLKALTDQSTTHYIRNYRLHRAADLLKQNHGTVSEIAYSVGFNSQTYFSSSFKELFGHAPSETG